MRTLTWEEFARLVKTKKYAEGYIVSDEKEGTFAGPIGGVEATSKCASFTVSSCTRNGKPHGENYLVSSFGYDGVAQPHLSSDGVIGYYLLYIGSVRIYPKGHSQIRSRAA